MDKDRDGGSPVWHLLSEGRNFLQSTKTKYLIICLGYITIFVYHTRHSISAYYARSRAEKSLTLGLHVLAAVFELTRYYARAWRGTVHADLLDTTACLIHSFTSLRLARTLRRGDETTRASYQAPAMLRPLLSLAAVVKDDAFAHQACVKLLHAFLYTRLLIFVAKRIGLGRVQTYPQIYAQAVTLGAILAIISSEIPAGVPIYISAVSLVMVYNQRTSLNLASSVAFVDGIETHAATRAIRPACAKNTKMTVQQAIAAVPLWLGLFQMKNLKTGPSSSDIPTWDFDEYTAQKLATT